MSQRQESRSGTLREASQQRSNVKALDDWMKVALNVFFLVPTLTTFLYAAGAWTFNNNWLDNVLSAGAVCFGISGILMLNFVISMFKVKGD